MSDYSLMSLAPKRPGNFPRALPDSAGIPQSVRDEMLIAPFNDVEMVAGLIREHKDELAGVIVEPFQRIIPPAPGFLQALRKLTAEHGIPLIFDEVVTPDICTLGKVIGGGFPLAAIAGRDDIMSHFDRAVVGDEGFLVQIGTLSGNPVASAAGLASMAILRRPGAYERIFATGRELMGTLSELLKGAGIPAVVTGEPPLFDVVFTSGDIRNYRDMQRGDAEMMRQLNRLLRERGILKGESKYYISLAHDAADIRQAREAWESAIKELAKLRKAA
jgi:glutamate-1-semialdehyde 2,1-aminomutase